MGGGGKTKKKQPRPVALTFTYRERKKTMNKAGRILFLLLLLVTMSLAQPLLDGYKSIKWNTPLAEVASKFPNASNCLISADSLAENKGTQLETMAGTEIFNEIQCLEVEEDDAGMLKSFKYLFSDSSFIGLLYSNEQANPDDVIKAVSAKYGTAKKNVLMDTTVMGFKTKATMYEWKGQKGSIRAQVIIADGTALYDNYMQQQAYQMGVSELEMEMAKAVMEEQRKQLMQISVIGPLYISNLFIQKQKHLAAKQPKPVQPKKPSISDDF